MATDMPDAPPVAEKPQESLEQMADRLYDLCTKSPKGTIFFQHDLSDMAVAETVLQLMTLIQELVNRHLMKVMTWEGDTCWKLRSREDADKLRTLNESERLLYTHIDQAGVEGIWVKALRLRTNFPTAQGLTKCLKGLENKGLVQSVMSVKHPNRKIFLLKNLTPSEEIAGGPWQSEGEYDTALIETITRLIEQLISRDTCTLVPPNYNNYDRDAVLEQKKREHGNTQDMEDFAVKPYQPPRRGKMRVPLHKPKKPTALSLRDEISALGIIKDKKISEGDMEQLLDMMVLEGRLYKQGINYVLPMKPADEDDSLNGFVDAPCGTCPVFDLCGESKEVNAKTCVYFGEWLGTQSKEV